MIKKHPQIGSSKGISTFPLGGSGCWPLWPAGKTYEGALAAWAAMEEQYLPTIPVSVYIKVIASRKMPMFS